MYFGGASFFVDFIYLKIGNESKGGIYELKFEKQENLSKKLDELIIQPYKILQFVRKKPIQTTLKF
jgi:hypothetical protein